MSDQTVEPVKTPQQRFEESIRDRLRADIGTLMPDEVLASLVERAVKDMFFTRRERQDRWNHTEILPSWFEEACANQLRQVIDAYTKAYFETHRNEIMEAVTAEI